MDATLYCVQSDGVMGSVGSEDGDGIPGGESVDGGFVGVCVTGGGV